jgi:hypothetical protein
MSKAHLLSLRVSAIALPDQEEFYLFLRVFPLFVLPSSAASRTILGCIDCLPTEVLFGQDSTLALRVQLMKEAQKIHSPLLEFPNVVNCLTLHHLLLA